MHKYIYYCLALTSLLFFLGGVRVGVAHQRNKLELGTKYQPNIFDSFRDISDHIDFFKLVGVATFFWSIDGY